MANKCTQNAITCLCIIDCGANAYRNYVKNIAVVFYDATTDTKLYWITTNQTKLIKQLQEGMKYNISYIPGQKANYITNIKIV